MERASLAAAEPASLPPEERPQLALPCRKLPREYHPAHLHGKKGGREAEGGKREVGRGKGE